MIVNWLMPSAFAIIWFSVFGGCAINWQINGVLDIATVINDNGTYAAYGRLSNNCHWRRF